MSDAQRIAAEESARVLRLAIKETLDILAPPFEGLTRRMAIHMEKLQGLLEPITPKPAAKEWPRLLTCYLHGSKETMFEKGHELGLKGAALDQFRYALYEVELELWVNRDGTYKIARCGP